MTGKAEIANVLQKIVADKRVELEKRKAAMPLEGFIEGLTPSNKSMYDALSQQNAGYIFECKKASPSKGLIREHFDLDEIIGAYQEHAAAISVLTDEKYFQGRYEYLEYVTQRVSQPVLNKDFFVEPYQVHLARKYNADAILLMLSVLNDEEYQQLAELADHYQLDVLTEVSNEEEAHRAVALKAKIIGINNRNLRDLSTDLAATEKLVPLIKQHAKHEYVLISESGIYTHQDVLRLAPLVQGFLVGSSLMAEKNLKLAVSKLVYGEVKICGITSLTDARVADNSGANYLGLIFAAKSKRRISTENAKEIVKNINNNFVGVFVNEEIENVVEVADELKLAAVQLHGTEDKKYIEQLRQLLPANTEIWQAHGVENSLPQLDLTCVDKVLLDCKVGAEYGGTGQQFNWRLLDKIKDKSNVILAGGLSPSNIREAVAAGTAILDVNSGVEDAPGVKNSNKIKELFTRLRTY